MKKALEAPALREKLDKIGVQPIREEEAAALAVSSRRALRIARCADDAGGRISEFRLHALDRHPGPAGTPKAITEKLNAEMKKALEAPALREKLDKIGVQPMPMSPEGFAALVKDEIKIYGDFVKKSGIKMN